MKDAADKLENRIFETVRESPGYKKHGTIPASCYRRMDAGAVGSLVADYPLQITGVGDDTIMATVNYLIENSFLDHTFFQDMIHSGMNAYLTLEIAQTLLRSGDDRYRELIRAVADLASPTGQWPEAVNPITKGGCMGDGQHGWADAGAGRALKSKSQRTAGPTAAFSGIKISRTAAALQACRAGI